MRAFFESTVSQPVYYTLEISTSVGLADFPRFRGGWKMLKNLLNIQNIRRYGGGRRLRCGTNWPTEVANIATPNKFDVNDRFSTTSCDPCMGHAFRLFFTHFTIKRTQRMAFEKNTCSKNETRQKLKD
jgi:hypothetical protein